MVPPQLRLARARKTRCSPRAEWHLSLAEMSAPTSSAQPQALAARGCTHASGRLGSKSLWLERMCREHDCLLFPDCSSLCLNKGTCRRLAISLAVALGALCTFGLAAVRHSRRGLHVGALPAANITPPPHQLPELSSLTPLEQLLAAHRVHLSSVVAFDKYLIAHNFGRAAFSIVLHCTALCNPLPVVIHFQATKKSSHLDLFHTISLTMRSYY